jgi:hypothetical protein
VEDSGDFLPEFELLLKQERIIAHTSNKKITRVITIETTKILGVMILILCSEDK